MNQELGLYTMLKEARSSKKEIEDEGKGEERRFAKTSLGIFKENWRVVK